MRKQVLALSGGATSVAVVLLALAVLDIAPGRILPLGILAAVVGLNALAGVLLMGQRVVMERTSSMARALGGNVGGEGLSDVPDDVIRAIDEAMQALAWSIDARIVGLAEHFTATDVDGTGDDD
jgi:hypothetical protein